MDATKLEPVSQFKISIKNKKSSIWDLNPKIRNQLVKISKYGTMLINPN